MVPAYDVGATSLKGGVIDPGGLREVFQRLARIEEVEEE